MSSIRSVLKAFEAQVGYEVKQTGEEKRRAIYSVDVQFNQDREQAKVLGFSFAPADNLDYDQAFKALFLDEISDLAQI